jgi:hypothetical protein
MKNEAKPRGLKIYTGRPIQLFVHLTDQYFANYASVFDTSWTIGGDVSTYYSIYSVYTNLVQICTAIP